MFGTERVQRKETHRGSVFDGGRLNIVQDGEVELVDDLGSRWEVAVVEGRDQGVCAPEERLELGEVSVKGAEDGDRSLYSLKDQPRPLKRAGRARGRGTAS